MVRNLHATLLALLAVAPALLAQGSFPLESVAIAGSAVPQPVILELSGLKLGSSIDKPAIESACKKLQETGLFASVDYRYQTGPNKGYALTLNLEDQSQLIPAEIDIPGVDDAEVWQWLAAKFGRFDRKVPEPDAAHQVIAREIESHLAARSPNLSLNAGVETDLATGKTSIVFRPKDLKPIVGVTYTGNRALKSADLDAKLRPLLANVGYTDRRFARLVELNLRAIYEEQGFYRVRFRPTAPKSSAAGVTPGVVIEEGEPYKLGKVDIIGEALPVKAMLAAADLPKGKTANWRQIQDGVWAMEKLVRRSGYYTAAATPERIYNDADHVLDLRVLVAKGPLYHFGELRITGLSPTLEQQARGIWKMKPGDPYDYAYFADFFGDFTQFIDVRALRKYDALAHPGKGEHVVDLQLVFEAR